MEAGARLSSIRRDRRLQQRWGARFCSGGHRPHEARQELRACRVQWALQLTDTITTLHAIRDGPQVLWAVLRPTKAKAVSPPFRSVRKRFGLAADSTRSRLSMGRLRRGVKPIRSIVYPFLKKASMGLVNAQTGKVPYWGKRRWGKYEVELLWNGLMAGPPSRHTKEQKKSGKRKTPTSCARL